MKDACEPREHTLMPARVFQRLYQKAGPECSGHAHARPRKKLDRAATFFSGRIFEKEELLGEGKYKALRVGNFFTNDQ
ncbi:MAG: hypothetical protein ACOX5J_08040 [Candidatus Hydrogenedentales bacterium]